MSTSENTKEDEDTTIIIEGSTTMRYSSKEKGNVFYNPVQVQNRDLSILMIALYAERRMVRNKVKAHKKELNKKQDLSTEEKEQLLQEYKSSLDGTKLVKDDDRENGITVLDALAASGLRSIRYWKEIPGVRHVTINDLDPLANKRAHENLFANGLADVVVSSESASGGYARETGILVQHGDATHEMYLSRRQPNLVEIPAHQAQMKDQFDVIDLDPYGSAAPFLDAAVQAITNGGLLCVTCTDMPALGGSHPETAYGRYGSIPIPNARYLQEVALRILLCSISTTAAKYGRTIRPILSVGMAFYIRVFVEVHNDKAGVNALSTKIGHVHQSTVCPSFYTFAHGTHGSRGRNVYQPSRIVPSTCQETGAPLKVGGPMWLGPLHDEEVVQEALERLEEEGEEKSSVVPDMELIETKKRLHGLLASVSEELNDVPLFYTLPGLCSALGIGSPRLDVIKGAIVNAGYRVSGYHKEPQAIKTDAPNSVVWDIMRAWYKKDKSNSASDKPKKKKQKDTTEQATIEKILSVEPKIEVDFSIPQSQHEKRKATRFPRNPEKNWGPKPASGMFSKKRKKQEEENPEERDCKK